MAASTTSVCAARATTSGSARTTRSATRSRWPAESEHPGTVEDNRIQVTQGERVAADGAFKVPSLRNVELTGPYFHNGGTASLMDVVQFYARGGDFREQNIDNLDLDIHWLRGLVGHPMRQIALADFLT